VKYHLWRFVNRIAMVLLNPNHLEGAMARIPALEPPFTPDVAAQLATMMPAGMPPIGLFRTFAKNSGR